MWRHIAIAMFLITQVNCDNVHTWQNSLFGCLEGRGHQSLAKSYKTLIRCNIIKYCSYNNFNQFTKTVCGLILSDEEKSHMEWWITQSKRTVLKWNIVEFMVFKNDAKCSLSHLAWITDRKRSYYCGYHLPWKQFSKGSVTVIQRFIMTLKQPSHFKLFFTAEHNVPLTNKKKTQFDVRTVQQSPIFSHFVQTDDLIIFLTRSFPFHVLDITVISVKKYASVDLTIHDGPSRRTPTLFNYNRFGNNSHGISTSSFQAVLIVHINTTQEHVLCVNWSSHMMVMQNKLFTFMYGTGHTSQNGLIYLMSHMNDHRITLNSYSFNGPDTFSNDIDLFCQYGGIWLYSSSEKTFANPVLLLEQCTNEGFRGQLYSKLQYFAFVVVQYTGISISTLKYCLDKNSRHPSLPIFDVSPVYPDQTIILEQQFLILQIFTGVRKLDNVSIYITDASNTHDIVATKINFKHITPEKGCACKAIIWYVSYLLDEQS